MQVTAEVFVAYVEGQKARLATSRQCEAARPEDFLVEIKQHPAVLQCPFEFGVEDFWSRDVVECRARYRHRFSRREVLIASVIAFRRLRRKYLFQVLFQIVHLALE